MNDITIVYWTGTGNTEAMADLIVKGIKETRDKINIFKVDEVDLDIVNKSKTLVLGCPSMGAEVLEESSFQPFMDKIYNNLDKKNIALFGSYGWGDGEWMRNWEDSIESSEGELLFSGLIINEYPEDEEECIEFGRKIASIE